VITLDFLDLFKIIVCKETFIDVDVYYVVFLLSNKVCFMKGQLLQYQLFNTQIVIEPKDNKFILFTNWYTIIKE